MSPAPDDADFDRELSRQRDLERQSARERVAQGDPAWQHEQGIMAAVDAVRDLQFPLTADEVRQRAGERYVQASGRLSLPLAELLAHLPETSFTSLRDFERAVQKHWQAIRFLELPKEQRPPEGGFNPTQRKDWPHGGGKSAQGLQHVKGGED